MIALMDSGIGGLNVYHAIRELSDDLRIIYIADNHHFPYGNKTRAEILEAVTKCLDGIKTFDVETIYIACHTASIALEGHPLAVRTITGATKELIQQTAAKGTVAILGTDSTIQSGHYQKLFTQYGAQLVEGFALQELIGLIEDQCDDEDLLLSHLEELVQFSPEVILLASTHFLHVLPQLKKLFPHTRFLDPAKNFAEKIITDSTPQKPTDLSEDLFITTRHNPKLLHLLQKNPINNLLKKGVGRV